MVLLGLCLVIFLLITAGFGTLGEVWSWSHFQAERISLEGLLLLFRCTPWSAAALLGGTLPLLYCAGKFASRVHTWRLPASGYVSHLVTE